MNRKYRSWIPGIVVWSWLLVSLALVKRHPWVDFAWNAVWFLLLLVIAAASVIEIIRNRNNPCGYISYRGVPRWVATLFGSEPENEKPAVHSEKHI